MAEDFTDDSPKITSDVTDDVVIIEKNFDYLIHRFGHRIDPDAGDQASGTGSLGDVAAALTTSKTAVVYFPHLQKDQNTTKYTLDTNLDLSAYTNLYYYFAPGAYLDQNDGDEVLIIYSPENIISPKNAKIFDGDMIDFANGGKAHLGWWGATTTGLQAAVNALNNGGGGEIYMSDTTVTFATGTSVT